MPTIRHALVAAALAGAAVPASAALATTDVAATIRALASDAAELVAEEQRLVTLADPRNSDVSPAEQRDAAARLPLVDARGEEILVQLDRLDVDVTEAMRATLEPLPFERAAGPAAFDIGVPRPDVYEAAVADLERIASTPSRPPAAATTSQPAIGLLTVAALSLLALGAAALGNTLRRRPETEELAAMAWSDGLTGLANRRRLDHDLAAHQRSNGTTSVIMIDVDHFKRVNDSYGHQHGDEILRQVGTMLSENVRHDDVVYRYGGEEFCVLLPHTGLADATVVAERIVESARTIELPDGAHITVSIGVAGSDGGDVAAAVVTADRALFDAKDRGRDRAVAVPGGDTSLEPA